MSLSHELLRTIIIGVSFAFLHIESSGQNIRNDSPDVESNNSEEIPLAEVWSNRIPGTRDVFELEPEVPPYLMKLPRDRRSYRHRGGTLTQQIDQRLGPGRAQEWSENNNEYLPPLKMFAVPGHGQAALVGAHRVLVKGETPQQTFSRGDNITLVFFSHWSEDIHFRRIMRMGNELTIAYQFVFPQFNVGSPRSGYVHVALIPVSSVQSKELIVKLERVPTDNAEMEKALLESSVSIRCN